MKLELSEDERKALLRVVEVAVRDSRYPLSPEPEALRRVAENLHEEAVVPQLSRLRDQLAPRCRLDRDDVDDTV